MGTTKQERMLEIFFRCLHGEEISVQKTAVEYGVSTKSISRNINDLKAFLADHRDLVGNAELKYSNQSRCYRLCMDEYLSNKELFAVLEVIIGAQVFDKEEVLQLTEKLKRGSSVRECPRLNELIRAELYHYPDIRHKRGSVLEKIWRLTGAVTGRREISVDYYASDSENIECRLCPVLVTYCDGSFYLCGYEAEGGEKPVFIPIETIEHIVEHRKSFRKSDIPHYEVGEIKRMIAPFPKK